MINIIICDDNLKDANRIERIVRNYLKKIEHKIFTFNDYDRDFMKILDMDLSNKIYLMDIETPSMSGIDVARRIRKKDYSSVIIFLSVHDDLSRIVAKKNLMCLNFINKFDNLEDNLIGSLDLAMTIVGKKRRVRFESRGTIYNIDINKILYVTRDTVSRESIVVCDDNEYKFRINLKSIIKELDENFIQTHRACFVNKNRVLFLDFKKMCITFDNFKTTTLISKKYIERMVVR